MDAKEVIARRIAKEFKDGDVVNLGFGIPNLSINYIPDDVDVYLEAENGVLAHGRLASEDTLDPDYANSGGLPLELLPMASTFDLKYSFAMIRGGHIDLTILGALEVAQNGDIANWKIPGKLAPGMGGAMDLLAGAEKIIASLKHTDKEGNSKILKECTLPLSAVGAVDLIITELAVFEVKGDHLLLTELAPGVSVDEVLEKTEADVKLADDIKEYGI